MDSKITKFINEITRQICDPKTGIPCKFNPKPKTLNDWVNCLNYSIGWVNIGLEDKMVPYLLQLKIGEVISSEPFNICVYKCGFANKEICNFLKLDSGNCNYRVIMNYSSFSKLLNIIKQNKSNEYKRIFDESLKKTFSNVNSKTFWVSLLINDIIANYLFKNNLGEVITKEVDSKCFLKSNKNESVSWDKNEMETDIENTYDINNNVEKKYLENDIENQIISSSSDMKEVIDDSEKENNFEEEPLYRLVMNNKSLLYLIEYACRLNNNTDKNVNVYELLGGNNVTDDFLNIFGRLKL